MPWLSAIWTPWNSSVARATGITSPVGAPVTDRISWWLAPSASMCRSQGYAEGNPMAFAPMPTIVTVASEGETPRPRKPPAPFVKWRGIVYPG